MKTRGRYFVVPILFLLFAGCGSSMPEHGFWVFSESFDFSEGQFDWEVDFADYPAGEDDSTLYELTFAYTELPESVGTSKAMMLSGNNHSDDLFMFMKRKISGLSPNTLYAVVFDIELATDARENEFGIGGAPGESVFLKGGASDNEPVKIIDNDYFRLNVDKGNQSTFGEAAVVLGDISSPSDSEGYTLITRNNASAEDSRLLVRSNNQGEIWLFVGTDSGFEGTTKVYYTKVNVVFSTAN